MAIDKISDQIHTLTKIGQSFQSYAQLLENPNIGIDRHKLKEVLEKCAKRCLEIRNLLLEGVKE